MKIKINRESDLIDYNTIGELPEYYYFGNGVKLSNKEISEHINEIIADLLKGKRGEYSSFASGDTFVVGFRYGDTDSPEEDYIEIYICKGYESLMFGVDQLEVEKD